MVVHEAGFFTVRMPSLSPCQQNSCHVLLFICASLVMCGKLQQVAGIRKQLICVCQLQ